LGDRVGRLVLADPAFAEDPANADPDATSRRSS
jgi:hypothetical protein